MEQNVYMDDFSPIQVLSPDELGLVTGTRKGVSLGDDTTWMRFNTVPL